MKLRSFNSGHTVVAKTIGMAPQTLPRKNYFWIQPSRISTSQATFFAFQNMTSIGPTLPPHLTSKRKREDDDGGDVNSQSRSRSTSLDVEDKRRRVLGPALPPAPIDERPTDPPGGQNAGEESESDDDFGPAPPSRPQDATSQQDIPQDGALTLEADKKAAKKPQREEWMLAPPTDGDWTSRIDPTKLKNRRFNTGKGARAPPPTQASDSNLWTETPEQKRKRLQEEVLGVAKPIASPRVEGKPKQSRAEAQEIEQRIQEYKVKLIVCLTHSYMLIFFRRRIRKRLSISSIKRRKALRKMTPVSGLLIGKRTLEAASCLPQSARSS